MAITQALIQNYGEHMKTIRLEIPVMVTFRGSNTVAAEKSQAFFILGEL
jgi:hypothetical protein